MAIFDNVTTREKVVAGTDVEVGQDLLVERDVVIERNASVDGNLGVEGNLNVDGVITVSGETVIEEKTFKGNALRGTPSIGRKARTSLEITGGISDGDILMLGDVQLEFDTDDSVEEGNTKVDISSGTPGQAEASLEIISFPNDGETITFGDDTYEIDALGTGVEAGNIQVDLSAKYVKASATLEFSGVVAGGETVTINEVVYQFIATGESVSEGNIPVHIGDSTAAASGIIALVAVINALSEDVVAADGALDTLVVTAKEFGEYANSFEVTTTCANGAWGAGTLLGGLSPTASEVVDEIVSASAGGTMAATFVAGEGELLGTLLASADALSALDGSAGNAVEVSSTSDYMIWSSETLEGGYDATAEEAEDIVLALTVEGFEIEEGTGDDAGLIIIKAEDEGEEGNTIEVFASSDNMTLGDDYLSGGLDADVYGEEDDGKIMFDSSNFYIASWDAEEETIVWKYGALSTLTSD